jgi:methionyl-tRNA formyltransferase
LKPTAAPLRVVFAGTPPFAAQALEALVAAGHRIPLVLTQPDRPAGRGMKLTPSAVSEAAQRLGLPLAKPATLKEAASVQALREVPHDVMVVAAYGLLLPQAVLDIPPRGCLNIHASLLPRWRGAAPIQRAILAGDTRTGISIMRMEAGLDTGPVVLVREMEMPARATTGSLTEDLAHLGAEAIVEALGRLDELRDEPQDHAHATYAAKVTKPEARIDWSRSNVEIDRQVRAFNPAPGAEANVGGVALKIWSAEPLPGEGSPGAWIGTTGSPVVACGSGALRLVQVQRPGGRRLSAEELARGDPRLFQAPLA